MKRLSDLYNLINNPITDEIVRETVHSYSKGEDIYSFLVHHNHNLNYGRANESDLSDLYICLYNLWIDNIRNISLDDFLELKNKGIIENDFAGLRNKLMDIGHVTSTSAIESLKGDPLVKKYGWEVLETKWNVFSSERITYGIGVSMPVEARLYINPDSKDVCLLAKLFVEECLEHNLPFNFKFDTLGKRDDSFIIYTSNEHIMDYLKILDDIAMNHRDIIERVGAPPILTGRVNNWVGIGTEPYGDGEQSFNGVRSEVIEKSINISIINYLMENFDTTITIDRVVKPFSLYIAEQYAEFEVKKNKEDPKYQKSNRITSTELDNLYVRNELVKNLEENIRSMLIAYCTNREDPSYCVKTISVPFGEKGAIEISEKSIIDFIAGVSDDLINDNPVVFENICREIHIGLEQIGISPVKSCFNRETVESFLELDLIRENEESERLQAERKARLSAMNEQKVRVIEKKIEEVDKVKTDPATIQKLLVSVNDSIKKLSSVNAATVAYENALEEQEEVRRSLGDPNYQDIRVNLAGEKLENIVKTFKKSA